MNINTKTNRHSKLKLRIVLTILFLTFLFAPMKPAQAALWPGIDPNIKQMLEVIQKRIEGIILGMLKQQALQMLTQQISSLVGGQSSGSIMFITDWRDYLVKQPEDLTKTYMNDYLSQVMKGKGSLTGYRAEGFSGGSGGSYASQLEQMVKKNVIEPQKPALTYEGDPSQMFAGGNFKQMSQYLSGVNNPWAMDMHMQSEKEKKLAEEKKIAEIKAGSYDGFKGTGEKKDGTGLITNPGSIIKENVANVQDLGNKIIAASTHPEEVISSVVSQIMTQAIQQGIGEAQKIIEREVNGVQEKLNKTLNQNDPNTQYKDCYGKPDGTSCNGTAGTCKGGVCVAK